MSKGGMNEIHVGWGL